MKNEYVTAAFRALSLFFSAAVISCGCGNPKIAVGDYPQIIRTAPDAADTFFNKAVALGILKKHEESAELFERALEIDSGDADCCFRLGMAYLTLGRREEAKPLFQKAFASGGFEALHRRKGLAYFVIGNFQQAIAEYEKAIDADEPHPVKNLCDLGMIYIHLENHEKTVEMYERAIHLNPENAKQYSAFFNLATAYQSLKNYDTALEFYARAQINTPGKADIYWNRALIYIDRHEWDNARNETDTLMRMDPERAKKLIDAYFSSSG